MSGGRDLEAIFGVFPVGCHVSVDLSVIVPYFDDFEEAVLLGRLVRNEIPKDLTCEQIYVQIDPTLAPPTVGYAPEFITLSCPQYSGLPLAKNLGLQVSKGELILFVFPGLKPEKGSIVRLLKQLREHPEWGAVAGRWNNEHGRAEKGYNVRQFPSFLALVFDILFINKIFPGNGITRRYKMHDFDHNSLIKAEHANDCIFLTRRSLLTELGKFNQTYHFAWFDQVEMCAAMSKAGRPVYYDPDAVFTMIGQPLVNRVLILHYRDYHADLVKYVAIHCKSWQSGVFKIIVLLGMAIRLLFSHMLPRRVRVWLLRHFRSYVSDDYIQSMSASYKDLFKNGRLAR
jgi:GT2 family glycosyltransferase